jgi:hypothetical protein
VSPGAGGALAGGGGAAQTTDYSRLAHRIVSESRFRPAPLPRPLHGVLAALGNALVPVGRALHHAFSAVARVVPGGRATVWVLLGAGVVVLAALVTVRLTGRTLAERGSLGTRPGGAPAPPTARALEAAADAAERDGCIEAAVRLRFQAGLLALDELGALDSRPSLPNAAVARRLRSPTFDGLLRRFEEVVYGGRPVDPNDAGRARDGWRRVLDDAARR